MTIITGNFMKTIHKMSIFVVLIAILASVPSVNATGYMDGSNWTGIDSIIDSYGVSYLKSNNGMSNPATTDFDVAGYNVTNATNISAKNIGGVIYADQYATIQDAINASRGKPVFMPCGVYTVSQNVKVKSGQELYGAGDCSIIALANNSLMGMWNNFGIVVNENTTIVGTSPTRHDTDIYLHDFAIDGNGKNQVPNFTTNHGDYIGNGIRMYPVANTTIERVTIRNTIGGGISLYGALYPGYEQPNNGQNKILYNRVYNSGVNHTINRDDIIAAIIVDDQGSGLTIVQGNTIQDSYLVALMDEDTRGMITYSQNTINNTYKGYTSISAGLPTVFIDNMIDTTVDNGIDFAGSVLYPTISGNTIIRAGNYGIKSTGGTYEKNKILYSGGSGIFAESPYISLKNNFILDSGQNISKPYRDGITVNGSPSQLKIIANDIWDTWQQGINPLTGGSHASQQTGINYTHTTAASLVYMHVQNNFIKANNISASNLTSDMLHTSAYNEISGNSGIQFEVHNNVVRFGSNAIAPTAFGAGDSFYNSTANILQIYTGSIWEWFVTSTVSPNNIKDQSINFVINNGSNVIGTGIKGDVEIPFTGTIIKSTALADQTGSVNISWWKDSYANFPPTSGDMLGYQVISSSNKGQSTGLTQAVTAGDILRFNVESADIVTRVTISLTVRRS